MTEKIKIDIVIDGRNFTVIGTESEEYVKALAQYVDKKIVDLASKNSKLSQTMSATLAALNITDEFFKLKEKFDELDLVSKEPLEKYDDLISQLAKSEDKVDELNILINEYKNELSKEKQENNKMDKEMINKELLLEMKEKELGENQKIIKSLQDKIFDGQMELIEIKKELEEAKKPPNHEGGSKPRRKNN